MINSSLNKFWSLNSGEAFTSISSSDKGLSTEEAKERLKKYGANTFRVSPRSSTILLFLVQFKSPITILLMAAALLSMSLGDISDGFIIVFIILVSSCLGFWQERGAANAVTELLKMVQLKCSIVRDGKQTELPVDNVVPGDIVILSAGDMIPADCLLLDSKELFIDEAAFTGESFPVEKNIGTVATDMPLAKRSNALFMGSHVISGKARALAVATGKQTEFGKISDKLRVKNPETDFEKGIRHFGYLLMELTLVLILVIFSINILLHKPVLDSFLFSLALAVGLTPQLLPAIISVNLSVGARSMAKQQVIVKRLASIENFGSMNILCSDKTGTITEGKVTLKDALDIEGNHSEKTLQYAWLNATMQQGFKNPIDAAIRTSYQGNSGSFTVQAEIPYDFSRKRLTIQVKNEKENLAITKGALNTILDICDTAEMASGQVIPLKDELTTIEAAFKKLSAEGFRVLGVAYKKITKDNKFIKADEQNMVFLGFITLFDPPKKGVEQTIRSLSDLGVKLKLITGDNSLVATSLAKKIGIETPVILSGLQIRNMSDSALLKQAPATNIFAEVEPNQKERIIVFLQRAGNVVGFMGDGINDAPALHAADVGISVDTAVDVAKEAADIILLRQDLNVLTTGIVVGRKTFSNTMKYIFMATSANFGNMFSMAGASLFLPFLPLLPKQILFMNLLTDLPQMAIATDSVDAIAVDKPHRWNIKFIKRFMITFGLLSCVFDYLTFGVLLLFIKEDEKVFQTGWFVESVISATLIILVVRTRLPFFKSLPGKYLSIATSLVVLSVLALPLFPFAGVLGFVQLPLFFYGWMILIVIAYVLSAEKAKQWFYRKLQNQG